MTLRLTIFFSTLVVTCFGSDNIETHFKICNRNSPDVNDCLVEAVQQGIAAMAGGINGLGVPPIDPFFQKEYLFVYKKNQIQAKLSITDYNLGGFNSSTVRDARLQADEDSFHLEVDMFIPLVSIKGKYTGNVGYNALNFRAMGIFNTSMSDLVCTWKLHGKPVTIGDEVFMKIKSFYMRPDISNMRISLTNESPDSKDITDIAVKFLNENWKFVYKETLPIAQAGWNDIGTNITNAIFLKEPYNKLFPV